MPFISLTHGWTLGQLLGCYHLDIHVPCLAFAPGFDQPLEHFGRTDFDEDVDGRQRGFGQLAWMVDCVAVEHNKLHGTRKFKDALDFRLNFGYKEYWFVIGMD